MNCPRIDIEENSITLPDGHRTHVLAYKMPSGSTPQVVVLEGFLTHAECDELIELAKNRLTPAEVISSKTGNAFVSPSRIADMVSFDGAEYDLTRRIEARIEALTHWPSDHFQHVQIIRYDVGGEYKPHHDCYNPDMPVFKKILEINGQRLATFLMYLNDCPGSGATAFPRLDGLFVCPQKGNALFFCYPADHDGKPDLRFLHAAGPVFEGEKWIATTWLCERRDPSSTAITF
jgi:prolyl 4-hydroxylase